MAPDSASARRAGLASVAGRWWGRGLALFAGLALIAAVFFLLKGARPPTYNLRMSAGDALGRRHQLATILSSEGRARGLKIRVLPTGGSADTVRQVADGRLDFALIQGGQGKVEGVMLVAALSPEPLHLNKPLVTPDAVEDLENLRSFLGSVAIGLFLLWCWSRRRRFAGFETYLDEATRIERAALALEREPMPHRCW